MRGYRHGDQGTGPHLRFWKSNVNIPDKKVLDTWDIWVINWKLYCLWICIIYQKKQQSKPNKQAKTEWKSNFSFMRYLLYMNIGVTGQKWQNYSIWVNSVCIQLGVQKSKFNLSSLIQFRREFILMPTVVKK